MLLELLHNQYKLVGIILYILRLNDEGASADPSNRGWERHISSTFIPPLRRAFTSNLVLAGCKNRPPPSPSSASARNAPRMVFHGFWCAEPRSDAMKTDLPYKNVSCHLQVGNQRTAKCSVSPVSCYLLSSLTARVICTQNVNHQKAHESEPTSEIQLFLILFFG